MLVWQVPAARTRTGHGSGTPLLHRLLVRRPIAAGGDHRPCPTLARAIDELIPGALHDTEQYANNRIECVHDRFKVRLRPMRGIKTKRIANTLIRGHAFIQNLRRGHYELDVRQSATFCLIMSGSSRCSSLWIRGAGRASSW